MPAPSVRMAKLMKTPKGDTIQVWDLRFKKPNHGRLSDKGIHTFEHYFAGFMREHLNNPGVVEVIDISPMGCKTGFYMSLIGDAQGDNVAKCFELAIKDIASLDDNAKIPAANEYQCGSCDLHSLSDAKAIAKEILDKGIVVVKNEDIALAPEKLKDLA